MLFVTLHGGNAATFGHRNNIHAYDKEGNKLSSSVLDDAEGIELNELRGIYLDGDLLYVVNANKKQNCVLCYRGSGVRYKYCGMFISSASCESILHPFDLAFDDIGHCAKSARDDGQTIRERFDDHHGKALDIFGRHHEESCLSHRGSDFRMRPVP